MLTVYALILSLSNAMRLILGDLARGGTSQGGAEWRKRQCSQGTMFVVTIASPHCPVMLSLYCPLDQRKHPLGCRAPG